jgi:hypothetical protein
MSNEHGHDHDDAVEAAMLQRFQFEHREAMAHGLACEFIHAMFHHMVETVSALPMEQQEIVLADIGRRADVLRAHVAATQQLLATPTNVAH